jgi:hypothetical protein
MVRLRFALPYADNVCADGPLLFCAGVAGRSTVEFVNKGTHQWPGAYPYYAPYHQTKPYLKAGLVADRRERVYAVLQCCRCVCWLHPMRAGL